MLATGSSADIARVILVSASLYATPPRPEKDCFGIIGLIEGNLQLMEMEKGNVEPANSAAATLAGAPADVLVHTLNDLGITSMWMWPEAGLKNWDNDEKVFKKTSVMVGDVEFEVSFLLPGNLQYTDRNSRCSGKLPSKRPVSLTFRNASKQRRQKQGRSLRRFMASIQQTQKHVDLRRSIS